MNKFIRHAHTTHDTQLDRRDFLGIGAVATAGWLAASASTQAQAPSATSGKKFKLKYAPMFGAFEAHAGKDPIAQLNFMAEAGFTALLDGGFLKKPQDLQEKIAKEMEKLGMTLGGPYCSTTLGGQSLVAGTDKKEEYAKHFKGVCEQLKRSNGKWFLVVPGALVKGMTMEQMTANVIENMKAIMKEVEPTGCVMTLEPLNARNHPGLFLTKIPQAMEICKAVNSPSCKIVNDLYHQQITEGDLIPNITAMWSHAGPQGADDG